MSALANYALNYHFAFRSAKAHISALHRFTLVAMTGLAINTMLMAVMVETMESHYLFSQAISTGIVLFWNFILNLRWSFREATSN